MRKTFFLLIFLSSGLLNGLNAQWRIVNLDQNSPGYSNVIKFRNDSLGFVMGDHSSILKSDDGGETWNKIAFDIDVNIKDFQFTGDSSIYAVGDYVRNGNFENLTSKIVKSKDLGETWDSIANFPGKQLYSLYFYDNDTGIVAGYDGIYRTANSGLSWDTVWSTTQSGYAYGEVSQMSFRSKTGYAIGRGRNQSNNPLFDDFLLKSTDAGLTWNKVKSFQSELTTIYFINQDTGFVGTGSDSGNIVRTTDGGNTWLETQTMPLMFTVRSIHFASDMMGIAVGAPTAIGIGLPTSFFILKTIDGGLTWEGQSQYGVPLNSAYLMSDTSGFVSGWYSLIMKLNGNTNELPEDYPWYLAGGSDHIDDQESDESQIKLYPNPANEILYIYKPVLQQSIKSIHIISSTGCVMLTMKPAPGCDYIPIDLSNLASGLYLIRLMYSDRTDLLKVIKN